MKTTISVINALAVIITEQVTSARKALQLKYEAAIKQQIEIEFNRLLNEKHVSELIKSAEVLDKEQDMLKKKAKDCEDQADEIRKKIIKALNSDYWSYSRSGLADALKLVKRDLIVKIEERTPGLAPKWVELNKVELTARTEMLLRSSEEDLRTLVDKFLEVIANTAKEK